MKRVISDGKPPRMWIDGGCYVIQKLNKKPKKAGTEKVENCSELKVMKKEVSESKLVSNETVESETNPEFVKHDFELSTNNEGKLVTKFHLPLYYYKKLQWFPDLNKKVLENKTKTKIIIPKNKNQDIYITGELKDNIFEAREYLHSVINEIRNQSAAAQFISIPLTSEEILNNFNKFKEEVLSENIEQVEDAIFINAAKLHLTVCVFNLYDDNEKQEAINALNDYKRTVLQPFMEKSGPLKIKVSGIDCMTPNLNKVDVVYANAKIESEELNLQTFANNINNYFYERGLVQRHQPNVKLHMTLINTKYRQNADDSPKKRWPKKQSINATKIIEKYKDFYFGTCELNCIRLSLMSTVGEDGFYESLSVINI